MLPLRLAIFAAVFGIALSGLFWLLGNLSEPELLRSKQAVVVKGCDSTESEDAARICPQLFCQKYLLDSRAVELKYRFTVTVDRHSESEHLIGGTARPFVVKDPAPELTFACLLQEMEVLDGRVITPEELRSLASDPDRWPSLIESVHPTM
ncbi:hypothetical protein JM946_01230 [Steroidobacter sp. S1-65]|uniref:Uncharacterized protein n=1 Tax=Steroidobacter gossypii TaxID=2805490 RepID=A0ABS1WQU8_9GAMM|nr:hypothetical protein [Steroidobacter gossypii]MBM0103341.1 hypothetical protein [Steroidobacter gossypii]